MATATTRPTRPTYRPTRLPAPTGVAYPPAPPAHPGALAGAARALAAAGLAGVTLALCRNVANVGGGWQAVAYAHHSMAVVLYHAATGRIALVPGGGTLRPTTLAATVLGV